MATKKVIVKHPSLMFQGKVVEMGEQTLDKAYAEKLVEKGFAECPEKAAEAKAAQKERLEAELAKAEAYKAKVAEGAFTPKLEEAEDKGAEETVEETIKLEAVKVTVEEEADSE